MHNGAITLFGFLNGLTELDPGADHPTRLLGCRGHCTETTSAAWTPDGTRVVFVAQCGGGCGSAGDPYHGIRVLDVRTGEDRLVVPGDDFGVLDWSPDGTRIVYASRRTAQVYLMNADGSGRIALPGTLGGVGSLSWSPDGTKIAYSAFSQRQMYLYSFDRSTSTPLGQGRDPDWSPDGTRIVYSDLRAL